MSTEFIARLVLTAGHTLLHSLWQGGLVWLLTVALLRSQARAGARFKHDCTLLALLLLCAWVGFTAGSQWLDAADGVLKVRTTGAGPSAAAVGPAPGKGPALMDWLVGAYALGLLAMLLRFGGGLRKVYLLRKADTVAAPAALLEHLERLSLQLGMAGAVALRLSGRVAAPTLIGLLRPVILLPHSAVEELSPAALEAVLLHELAHLSRADYLVSLLQSLVEALLFFNPFVWLLSAVIRRERECCCDDLVVAQCGEPLLYAQTLYQLAARQEGAAAQPALRATGQGRHLFHRIKRILQMKPPSNQRGQLMATALLALLLAVSIAWFTPGYAQRRKTARTDAQTAQQQPDRHLLILVDSNGKVHRYERGRSGPDETAGSFAETDSPDFRRPPATPQPPQPPAPVGAVVPPVPPTAPTPPIPPRFDSLQALLSQIDWQEVQRGIDEGLASLPDSREINARVRRELRRAQKEVEAALWESRQALADAGRERADALREANTARLEALQAADEARRDANSHQQEALRAAEEARRDALQASDEARREALQAAEEARREALEAQREAMESIREAQRQVLEESRRQQKQHKGQLRQLRQQRELRQLRQPGGQ